MCALATTMQRCSQQQFEQFCFVLADFLKFILGDTLQSATHLLADDVWSSARLLCLLTNGVTHNYEGSRQVSQVNKVKLGALDSQRKHLSRCR